MVPPQTGVGVTMIIARINSAIVDLVIAGIIVSPSMASPSGDKIRVFLSATVHYLGKSSSSESPRNEHNLFLVLLVYEGV